MSRPCMGARFTIAAVGTTCASDAARLGTLRAYDLRPSSPLAGKGLDLQRLFQPFKAFFDEWKRHTQAA